MKNSENHIFKHNVIKNKNHNIFTNTKQKNLKIKINKYIKTTEVRVISNDGIQLGIMHTKDAIYKAKLQNLDLVEVSPTANPPVCKIMDYGKFKYQQKRKAAENKKKQNNIKMKEVKFKPKTNTHDFLVKINQLKKFLKHGNKSKITIVFRGREIVHTDIGKNIMDKIIKLLNNQATIENHAKMDGRQMIMILSPLKN